MERAEQRAQGWSSQEAAWADEKARLLDRVKQQESDLGNVEDAVSEAARACTHACLAGVCGRLPCLVGCRCDTGGLALVLPGRR